MKVIQRHLFFFSSNLSSTIYLSLFLFSFSPRPSIHDVSVFSFSYRFHGPVYYYYRRSYTA